MSHAPSRSICALISLLFAVVVLAASGCNEHPPGADPAVTPAGEHAEGHPPPVPSAAAPLPGELEGRWRAASEGHKIASLRDTPQTPLRYALEPGCALVYDVDARATLAGPHDHVQQLLGRIDVRAAVDEPGRLYLTNRAAGHYHIRNDVRRPGREFWPGDLAPVELDNQGDSLHAALPPAALWSDFGAFRGLVHFFPALPHGTEAGHTRHWLLPAPPVSGSGVEGKGAPARAMEVEVRLSHWIEVDGTRAAVLEARHAGATTRLFGRYVVLVSGRLLHAAVHQQTDLAASGRAASDDAATTYRLDAELRLTGACNGPTLTPFRADAARAEQAMEVYTRVVHALGKDEPDPEHITPYLSHDLLDAHGESRLLALLTEHVARFGPDVLGAPSFYEPVESDGELLVLRLAGRARGFGSEGADVTVINHVVLEALDGRVVIMAIRTTSEQNTQNWNVLELSPARLFTAAAATPPSR